MTPTTTAELYTAANIQTILELLRADVPYIIRTLRKIRARRITLRMIMECESRRARPRVRLLRWLRAQAETLHPCPPMATPDHANPQTRWPRDTALPVAEEICARLKPACDMHTPPTPTEAAAHDVWRTLRKHKLTVAQAISVLVIILDSIRAECPAADVFAHFTTKWLKLADHRNP